MSELKERMSYSEFVKHIAFFKLFPWGEDWRQAEAIAASNIAASTKHKRLDIRPYFPKPRNAQQGNGLSGMFEAFKQIAIAKQDRGAVS